MKYVSETDMKGLFTAFILKKVSTLLMTRCDESSLSGEDSVIRCLRATPHSGLVSRWSGMDVLIEIPSHYIMEKGECCEVDTGHDYGEDPTYYYVIDEYYVRQQVALAECKIFVDKDSLYNVMSGDPHGDLMYDLEPEKGKIPWFDEKGGVEQYDFLIEKIEEFKKFLEEADTFDASGAWSAYRETANMYLKRPTLAPVSKV